MFSRKLIPSGLPQLARVTASATVTPAVSVLSISHIAGMGLLNNQVD